MERKTLALCFFLLFLFAAQELVVRTEGKECEALSATFRGICGFDRDCDNHCKKKEHLNSGRCMGNGLFRSKCYCKRNC